MNNITVDQAQYQLAQAQKTLEAAMAHQATIDTFGVPSVQYVVMAKVPEFLQFIAYPEAGVVHAVFADEAEATRYSREVKAPAGTNFVVEEIPAYV